MALTEAYFSTAKNVKDIFEAIINAQAPDKFTQKFLYDLGFTNVKDRPFIGVIKALGFLDESGVPKQRYYDYLDEDNSKTILAQAIREAYGDLFSVNQKAHEMTGDKVKGKLKSLLQGKKSDSVLQKMSTTFTALCELADFAQVSKKTEKKSVETGDADKTTEAPIPNARKGKGDEIALKYSINIELPTTRDKLVYDAIFQSVRENLL